MGKIFFKRIMSFNKRLVMDCNQIKGEYLVVYVTSYFKRSV